MGGRGSHSKRSGGTGAGRVKEVINDKLIVSDTESKKKMSKFGIKVQEDFIDYIKRQTNIDLTKARDTMFDTRKYFNIDVRNLGKNDLRIVQTFIDKYPGGYKVKIEPGGAYRKTIFVSR